MCPAPRAAAVPKTASPAEKAPNLAGDGAASLRTVVSGNYLRQDAVEGGEGG